MLMAKLIFPFKFTYNNKCAGERDPDRFIKIFNKSTKFQVIYKENRKRNTKLCF